MSKWNQELFYIRDIYIKLCAKFGNIFPETCKNITIKKSHHSGVKVFLKAYFSSFEDKRYQ